MSGNRITRFGRGLPRWAGASVIAAAAILAASIFGTARSGTAAIATAPSSSGAPAITGTPQPGSTLTASTGSWSGTGTISYTFAWSRCDQNGASCAPIGGATSGTYVLQNADSGSTLKVTVTATNSDGTAQATSPVTPVIGAPAGTAVPVISGTAQQGQTLTTSNGTWNGTAPIAYTYQWGRCDQNGASCAAISGATSQSYLLQGVDVGNTLRVTVTATNTAGSDHAQSGATSVVTAVASASTGCPAGTGLIQAGDVSAPAHLSIDQQTVTPGVVTPSSSSIQLRFRVTACGGRPVQGALVYSTAVPFNQFSIPAEATTGNDGIAVLAMSELSGFPAARKQQLLVVFVRARKPGDDVNSGINGKELVSFPVALR